MIKKLNYTILAFLSMLPFLHGQIALTPNAAPTAGMTTVNNYNFGMCGTDYGDFFASDTEEIYSYTATANVPCASINLNPNTQYTGVFVFEGALPTSTSDPCHASAYSGAFGNTDPVTANFVMTSGTTYYFVVTTQGEGDVSFNIDLDIPVIPTPNLVMNAASNGTTLNIADGTTTFFYDSGGPTCDYQLNENYTVTVCPDAAGVTADKVVQLEFTAFERNNTCTTSSEITFYKGTTATSGQEIFPGEYENVIYDEDVRIFTSLVSGGCMTIVWTNGTDTNCEGPGWEGNFTLVDNPCATPIADACADAPLLELGTSLETNTECFTGGSGACGIGSNNNGWFKFVTDGTSATIGYEITGGNACYSSVKTSNDEDLDANTGLQFLLYEGCSAAQQICTSVVLETGGINVETGAMASGDWTITGLTSGVEYYAQFDSYGSDLCNFRVTAGAGTALPIEMLSFSAFAKDESNILTWTTATEENTKAHIVERASIDNRFVEIGSLAAAGYSSERINYTFYDEMPLPKAHYRIKTVDIDGSESISSIVTVLRKQEGINIANVSPNPTSGKTILTLDADNSQEVVLSISSVTGKTLLSETRNIERGSQQMELDISDFPKGIYMINIASDTAIFSYKIVKE